MVVASSIAELSIVTISKMHLPVSTAHGCLRLRTAVGAPRHSSGRRPGRGRDLPLSRSGSVIAGWLYRAAGQMLRLGRWWMVDGGGMRVVVAPLFFPVRADHMGCSRGGDGHDWGSCSGGPVLGLGRVRAPFRVDDGGLSLGGADRSRGPSPCGYGGCWQWSRRRVSVA